MKKLSVFLMTALLASGAIAQTEFEQREYILRATAQEGPKESHASLVAACEAAIARAGITGIDMQGPNARADRVSLHRLLNQDKYGRVREGKSNERKRGEFLVCQDWDSYLLSGKANFIPSFLQVNLDGMTFSAEGGGVSSLNSAQLPGGAQIMAPQEAPYFYPAQDVLLVTTTATIMPSLPWDLAESLGFPVAENIGGTITFNSLLDLADLDGLDDQFESDSYMVVRLLIPVEN